MTLTSEYQYIGRSNAVSNPAGANFYILLYAKTSGDPVTGRHAVTVKQRLASTSGNHFFGYCTSGNAVVDGIAAFSWSWATVPSSEWPDASITEDGTTYNRYVDLKEGTVTIDVGHGKTKDIDITAYWVMNESNTQTWMPTANVYLNVNATVTLPMIAGASQPTVGSESVVMGEPVEISISAVEGAGFTHTVLYSFGSESGVIAENIGESASWTPPVTLASQIPNSVSGAAVITCQTYSGSTKIGETQITLTLMVPEGVVPTVNAEHSDASSAFNTLGVYVQNVTKLDISVDAQGVYSSTVTGASATLAGKAYAGGAVADCGDLELAVTVTDSRGRKGTYLTTIYVAPYAPPRLVLSASRCTADGTADDTGEYANVTISGAVTQVNDKNTAALTLSYSGTTEEVAISVGQFSVQRIIPADSNTTLNIEATLTDILLTTTRQMTLSTGYATLDLYSGGKGIAFGKTATREGFDCAMPAYFSGGMYAEYAGVLEYINPPLLLGVEYRTPKRLNNAPVFVQHFDAGALPNATAKRINTLELDCPIRVPLRIYGRTSVNNRTIPHGNYIQVRSGYGFIEITTTLDYSGENAFLIVEYVK